MKKTVMLKKNYEFRNVLTKGKYYGGKQIEAFIIKNKKEINKLGIAISKKVGKSVTRNKLKRLIRENYLLQEDDVPNGIEIVVLWKKKVLPEEASFYIIKKDFQNIFSNISKY